MRAVEVWAQSLLFRFFHKCRNCTPTHISLALSIYNNKIKLSFLHINKLLEQEPSTSSIGENDPSSVLRLHLRTVSSALPYPPFSGCHCAAASSCLALGAGVGLLALTSQDGCWSSQHSLRERTSLSPMCASLLTTLTAQHRGSGAPCGG